VPSFFAVFSRKDEGTFIFSKLVKTACEKLVVQSYCLQMKANRRPYRWVTTNGVHITKGSRQAKKIANSGISFPEKVTRLP